MFASIADLVARDRRRRKIIKNLREIQRKNPHATIPIAVVLDMMERIEKAPAEQEQEK